LNPIPLKLRKEIAEDPYMKKCCLCGNPKVQWNHAIIYKGRQLNEKWAIVPACEDHHDHKNREYIERLQLIALNRASIEQLQAISKAFDFIQRRDYLRGKYKDN
jgi:hypothetical protein